jgi:hypothetical protein
MWLKSKGRLLRSIITSCSSYQFSIIIPSETRLQVLFPRVATPRVPRSSMLQIFFFGPLNLFIPQPYLIVTSGRRQE